MKKRIKDPFLCSTLQMPITKKVEVQLSSKRYFEIVKKSRRINFRFSNIDVLVDRGKGGDETKTIVIPQNADVDEGNSVTIVVHHKNEGETLMGLARPKKENSDKSSF